MFHWGFLFGEEKMDEKEERKKFEKVIQYRQFLGRYKDGTYQMEWVQARWEGWMLCVTFKEEDYE
jgi:hypothetical protein